MDTPLLIIAVSIVAFSIGLSKGGFGGSLGAIATPLLALVLPTDQAIGLLLPLLICGDIFAITFHWRRWQLSLVLLLLPGAILGITFGTLFIVNAPVSLLRMLVGVIILILALYKLFEKKLLPHVTYQPRPWHGLFTGTVAGFSSTLAHVAGPIVTFYLLMQNLTPRTFVATSALFFGIINLVKVPFYLYASIFPWTLLRQLPWTIPLIFIGALLGRWLTKHIKADTYEKLILIILIVSASLLLLT